MHIFLCQSTYQQVLMRFCREITASSTEKPPQTIKNGNDHQKCPKALSGNIKLGRCYTRLRGEESNSLFSSDCGLQFFAMPRLSARDASLSKTGYADPVFGSKNECEDPLTSLYPRGSTRNQRHRLLSLDSGDALPFKRMHIFGRLVFPIRLYCVMKCLYYGGFSIPTSLC